MKNLPTSKILILTSSVLFCSIGSMNLAAQAPTISSISPAVGNPGTTVVITGSGFDTTPTNNAVFIGPVRATVNAATTSSMNVTVPLGAVFGPISVTNITTNRSAISSQSFLATFQGQGVIDSAAFDHSEAFQTDPNPVFFVLSDIDGDGMSDIVLGHFDGTTVSVLRNTSTSGSISQGSFASSVGIAAGLNPSVIAIGDMNGDSKPDVVVANYLDNTVSVLVNTSTPGTVALAETVVVTTANRPNDLVIADFDGDGRLDVAVAVSDNDFGVSVFINQTTSGSISFAERSDFNAGFYTLKIAAGDLDGDTLPDIATANFNSDSLSILRNTSTTGSLSFAARVDYETETDPDEIAIRDIDGDELSDIVVSNRTSNSLSVYRNLSTSGTIALDSRIDLAAEPSPEECKLGDIDGDGIPDLLVSNREGNSFSVYKNISSSGSINFQPRVVFATGGNTHTLVIGDIDLDGAPEVLTTQGSLDQVNIFHNDLLATADAVDAKGNALPTEFELSQNYPNPFNPTTTFRYALPEASQVTIKIYTMLGEKVVTLTKQYLPAGYHTHSWDASNLPSGIYFSRMTAISGTQSYTQTRKLILLK